MGEEALKLVADAMKDIGVAWIATGFVTPVVDYFASAHPEALNPFLGGLWWGAGYFYMLLGAWMVRDL